MSEQLIEGQESDVAKLVKELRDMAAAIEANGIARFGGCFVVLPPKGHDPLAALILDNNQDVAQFFAALQSKLQIALASLDDQQRNSVYRR